VSAVVFDYNPDQERVPAGSPEGGQFGPGTGAISDEATPTVEQLADIYNETDDKGFVRRAMAARAEKVFDALDYDDAPRVVTREELDEIARDSPVGLLHRVVDTEAQAEQFRTGKNFVGEGFFGSGTYTYAGTDEQFDRFAENFGGRHTDIGKIHMALEPDARILQSGPSSLEEYSDRHAALGEIAKDPGALAAAQGYDAINIHAGTEGYVLVLNRDKVIVATAA
jgi:hypothetical protein